MQWYNNYFFYNGNWLFFYFLCLYLHLWCQKKCSIIKVPHERHYHRQSRRCRLCLMLLCCCCTRWNQFSWIFDAPPSASALPELWLRVGESISVTAAYILSVLLNCPLKYVHIIATAMTCYYFPREHATRLNQLLYFSRRHPPSVLVTIISRTVILSSILILWDTIIVQSKRIVRRLH